MQSSEEPLEHSHILKGYVYVVGGTGHGQRQFPLKQTTSVTLRRVKYWFHGTSRNTWCEPLRAWGGWRVSVNLVFKRCSDLFQACLEGKLKAEQSDLHVPWGREERQRNTLEGPDLILYRAGLVQLI